MIDFRPCTPPELLDRLRQLRADAKRIHRYISGAVRDRHHTNHVADHPQAAADAVARLELLLAEATDLAHELLSLSFGNTPESHRERVAREMGGRRG